MKITVLVENTAGRDGLAAEHGLSLFVEAAGHTFLFDAGQSGAFARNAKALGVDLGRAEFGVLSHGHYDHGGGLPTFLEINPYAKIYVNQEAFGEYYNAGGSYIGLPGRLAESPRLEPAIDGQELAPGITLYTAGNRRPLYRADPFGLQMRRDGLLQPDDFRHEQYVLICEGNKRALLSGCSHRGILNIAEWFRPDVLIGGFHFSKLEPRSGELLAAARQLAAYPTDYYTCHCTGLAQFDAMRAVLGSRLGYLSTGTVLEL